MNDVVPPPSDIPVASTNGEVVHRRWKRWFGIGLVCLSGAWFAALALIPFTSLSLEAKAFLAIVFLALMEISFWLGALIVGKQVVSNFLKRLRKRST